LPRDLGDVLDYLLPVNEASKTPAEPSDSQPRPPSDTRPGPQRPPALPIVAVPIGERDVVRAAFAWNLAVEVARLGGSGSLVAPREADTALLWPDPGRGPVGAELVSAKASGLGDLYRAALDVAVARAADATAGGLVLVRVPPQWLESPADGRALLRWVLLFASLEPRDLMETYGLVKRLLNVSDGCRVGVTVHGVRRIQEAAQAFDLLAGVAARNLGRSLVSYGLLLDDLQVYRAIVSRRPIGIEHPQSRAARALSDVARLLLEDARDLAVA
jgi:hypothetical protein